MKKFLAMALALVMALSLAACGGKTGHKPSDSSGKEPGISRQEPATTPDPSASQSDDEDNEQPPAKTYDWPTADYISEGMKYTGTGNVVNILEGTATGQQSGDEIPYTRVEINTATLEEAGVYVDALKAKGFTYWDAELLVGEPVEEPELAFGTMGIYTWKGLAEDGRFIEVSANNRPLDVMNTYQISIEIYAKHFMLY